ncbi:MAG: primosomal protein N', partial [Ruminococcus bromii]|nr:primosomal protein N' [Ruminococcus bromii]
MLLAQLAVENTTYRFDKPFTYIVPEALRAAVCPGVRVTVPFGSGNRTRVAMVLALQEAEQPDSRLKAILKTLDDEPLLSAEMLELVPWMKSRYYCTLFEAVKLMIPAGIGYKIVNRYRISAAFKDYDRTLYGDLEWQIIQQLSNAKQGMTGAQLMAKLGIDEKCDALCGLLEKGIVIRENAASRNMGDATSKMICAVPDFSGTLSPKQQSAFDTLCDVGTVSVRELSYFTGVSTAVIKALADKGAAEIFEVERFRRPKLSAAEQNALPKTLSPEQARVAQEILRECDAPEPSVALLYGITGSGKTAVFMHVIRHVLDAGRGVIVTVPEISLTPQTLAVFTAAFGDTVAVFHSGLSMGERMDEWKRVRSGQAKIVVGTRSAVFAPVQNLGLIVMDEEQESTYKSESSPRYHAREIAKFRTNYNRAYCLLCSATPSVESYYMAKSGKYQYHELLNRYGEAIVPDVRLVDMNSEDLYRGKPLISMALARAVSENLEQGRQSILLLNRRGYHTYAVCRDCKTVVSCPNCSISLTYHAANNRLMCHYCGHSEPAYARCRSCGGELTFSGGGTQKAEDQLREAFPEARILRIDTDTTANKYALEKKLAAFSAGEYDIMVGTQMVAKGLDFENVTLVGVLSADQSLYSDDYRSNERTFDLLTQVVGRAGRGRFRGTALIQTHVPENPYLHLAARQDYARFFETEIRFRRAMLYPPFSDILQIGFVGEKEETVRLAAEEFSARLCETFSRDYPTLPIRLLRASAASVSRMGGKYRYKIIMKYKNTKQFREIIA